MIVITIKYAIFVFYYISDMYNYVLSVGKIVFKNNTDLDFQSEKLNLSIINIQIFPK